MLGVFLNCFLPYFLRQTLLEPNACSLKSSDFPASLSSPLECWDYRLCLPIIYACARDLNSGSHAYAAVALWTGPSPQLLSICFFFSTFQTFSVTMLDSLLWTK